jgi:hypothetical protein
MYIYRHISEDVKSAQVEFKKNSKTKQLIVGALFACIAAVLQEAGGFLPVLGYFISPFATAPILFCSMLSLPIGIITYFLTNLLLLILQPSELMVFPLTTGLLGLGTGAAFHFLKRRVSIIAAGASILTIGILSLLYIFQFPILGPAISGSFSLLTMGSIFLFSLFYSWIWVDISIIFLKRLMKVIT